MPKHTTGPWSIRGNRIERVDGIPGQAMSFDLVCTINEGRLTESAANARLIAAAPELLEALQSLAKEINLSKLKIKKDFSLINAHAAALKAIYKAKGE